MTHRLFRLLAVAIVALVSSACLGQTPISSLPGASAISGSELVPIVQSNRTVQTTLQGIKNFTLAGPIPPGFIPLPTDTTLGGVKSSTAPANQFATGISTAGTVTYAQPAFSNLSGQLSTAQLPSIFGSTTPNAGNVLLGNGSLFASTTLTGAISVSGGGVTSFNSGQTIPSPTLTGQLSFPTPANPTFNQGGGSAAFAVYFTGPSTVVVPDFHELDLIRWDQTITVGESNRTNGTGGQAAIVSGQITLSAASGLSANAYLGIGALNNISHGTVKGWYARANCSLVLPDPNYATCVAFVGGLNSGPNQNDSWGFQLNDNQTAAIGNPGGIVGGMWIGSATPNSSGTLSPPLPAIFDYGLLLDQNVQIRAGGAAVHAFAGGPGDFLSFVNAAGTANLMEVQADGTTGVGGVGARAFVGTEGLAVGGYLAIGTPTTGTPTLIGFLGNTGDGNFRLGTRTNTPVQIWVNQISSTKSVATFTGTSATFHPAANVNLNLTASGSTLALASINDAAALIPMSLGGTAIALNAPVSLPALTTAGVLVNSVAGLISSDTAGVACAAGSLLLATFSSDAHGIVTHC